MENDPEKESLEEILRALQHSEETVRRSAFQRLRNFAASVRKEKKYDAPPFNMQELWDREDDSPFFQQPPIIEALLIAIEDVSSRVRAEAVLMLWSVKTIEIQEVLIRHMLHDSNFNVRRVCAVGLKYSPDTLQKREAYLAASQDTSREVLVPVCQALDELGEKRAVEPLHALTAHPSWAVRFHACQTLVHLHAVDQSVVDLLEELNRHPEAEDHNQILLFDFSEFNQSMHREFGLTGPLEPEPDMQAWTTQAVLEQARRLLP